MLSLLPEPQHGRMPGHKPTTGTLDDNSSPVYGFSSSSRYFSDLASGRLEVPSPLVERQYKCSHSYTGARFVSFDLTALYILSLTHF